MSFVCTLCVFLAFITHFLLFSVTLYFFLNYFNRYFKPTPRWDGNFGTLYLPMSCPIQSVSAKGSAKILKQIACLEACKQLHQIGALTDNLVPDMVVEEDDAKELGNLILL